MIKVFIPVNQLSNFLINKEPVQFFNNSVDFTHVELILDTNKLIFNEYNTYITIELKTKKKTLISVWRKLWKKK